MYLGGAKRAGGEMVSKICFRCDGKTGYMMLFASDYLDFGMVDVWVCPNCFCIVKDGKRAKGIITVKEEVSRETVEG